LCTHNYFAFFFPLYFCSACLARQTPHLHRVTGPVFTSLKSLAGLSTWQDTQNFRSTIPSFL